jgi:hypothetical protein
MEYIPSSGFPREAPPVMIPKITPINSSNRLTTAHRLHLAMAWNKSFVVAVVMLYSSGSAGAVDVNSAPFQILSEGATTCGEFVAEPSMQSARMAWVLGYGIEKPSLRTTGLSEAAFSGPPQSLRGYNTTANFIVWTC